MKKFIQSLIASRLYRLGFCLILSVIFGALSNIPGMEFMTTVMLIPLAYVVWLALVLMAYAWVINPIKELKERRKNKK